MEFQLFNVSGTLINEPQLICKINAQNYNDAFLRCKEILSNGIKEELAIAEGSKIEFTKLCKDLSLGYGEKVRYTTCSVSDENGFVIGTYDYAIAHA